jgi:hypothetical protein
MEHVGLILDEDYAHNLQWHLSRGEGQLEIVEFIEYLTISVHLSLLLIILVMRTMPYL